MTNPSASVAPLVRAGNKTQLRALARQLRFLQRLTKRIWPVEFVKNFVSTLLSNPHIAELLRFIFLGTVVETSRLVGQKIVDFAKHFFVVKASFVRGDFAFDWVKRYLEDHHVWDESRVFRVTACNPLTKGKGLIREDGPMGSIDAETYDGRPHPVYQPAPREPELFRWRNHWISIDLNMNFTSDGSEGMQIMTLSVWSRNRKILDEFVQEARQHYFSSPLPPRELYDIPDKSGALLTARFDQGDACYEWMLAFIQSQEGYANITDLQVTTRTADLARVAGPSGDRPIAAFKPAPRVKQRLQWKEHWLQIDVEPSSESYEGRSYGGSITITLHNSKQSVMYDLVMEAHAVYLKNTTSKVTVHLSDRYGSWVKVVTKHRRALNTLILPDGVKERLLDDAKEFLASEEWYLWAGVPHRRGYLLYGEPGTGKSSTIHALASELGLEIYYIQLASQGMDDHNLARLISDTPSRCILLLEDIDCAFPSRDDEEDDEPDVDVFGNPVPTANQPRSEVTLSGLLNVLDSVTSEEGRITFATTNHIEKLDPALIRAGRMDVKVEYKLATREQIRQTFLRFYEKRFVSVGEPQISDSQHPHIAEVPVFLDSEIQNLADQFSDRIPEGTFALAQIQGFLLTKKTDPHAAAATAAEWVDEQLEEKRRIQELKEKRNKKRRERAERRRKNAEERKNNEGEEEEEGEVEEKKKSVKINGVEADHAEDVISISGEA